MEVIRRDFPKVIRDNDEIYFRHFSAIIESIDEYANMEIMKTPHSFHFRIAPSIPKYIEPLLQEILRFNNQYGIHLELSKSIKPSSTITFDIELINE